MGVQNAAKIREDHAAELKKIQEEGAQRLLEIQMDLERKATPIMEEAEAARAQLIAEMEPALMAMHNEVRVADEQLQAAKKRLWDAKRVALRRRKEIDAKEEEQLKPLSEDHEGAREAILRDVKARAKASKERHEEMIREAKP